MGIPKFFVFLGERYPCITDVVKEFNIPDFDNFYLDMNGIIHMSCHGNVWIPELVVTDEMVFTSVFHHIEVLFRMIKPKKLLFLALDGVAPRAKMNQQRARRFMRTKEVEMMKAKSTAEGKQVAEKIDTNCISPGTEFMARLHTQLKYFISCKLSTDPLWKNCKVILSGHQFPGEGEHKIMDYIRYMKTQPDYNPNTRHCLYGADADLILLGLSSHEPHFCILREKHHNTKKEMKKHVTVDEQEFYLVYLSLLRDYLELEFQEVKDKISFEYDLEKIIDDWILMSFFVGNDFIPNIPDFNIDKNALSLVYKVYKEVLPTLDGYINENGQLHLARFQIYVTRLAELDEKNFEELYSDFHFGDDAFSNSENEKTGNKGMKHDLEDLIKATNDMLELSNEELSEEDSDTFIAEFYQKKKHYYESKFGEDKSSDEFLRVLTRDYIFALQWNLYYYYLGCQSWKWFYPHHYSPFISDIKDFKDFVLNYDLGEPFSPFEQLLAILPVGSKALIPEVYHSLMDSPESPIIDFYPIDFEMDLNSKQHQWESVVLIPFVDQKRLLAAMQPHNAHLTEEEKKRNQQGPMEVFTYTPKNLGAYESVDFFPLLRENHAMQENVWREDLLVARENLRFGLRPGVIDSSYYRFKTLKHIRCQGSLKFCQVRVFSWPSKFQNIEIAIEKKQFPPTNVLAENLLGKIVHTNWPHLVESKVVAVADSENRYMINDAGVIKMENMSKHLLLEWKGISEDLVKAHAKKCVQIGPVDIVLFVKLLEGKRIEIGSKGEIGCTKIWSSVIIPAALQTTLVNFKTHDIDETPHDNIRNLFPVGSTVFMLGQPHFGSMGKVLESPDLAKNGRLKIELETADDFIIEAIAELNVKCPYITCKAAAACVGISAKLFSRITGIILVTTDSKKNSKVNIGLKLKVNSTNEEILGYTKKKSEFSWMYSARAIAVVKEYIEKFPKVIEYLSTHLNEIIYSTSGMFPGPEGTKELQEIQQWLDKQEYHNLPFVTCGGKFVEREVIENIEKIMKGMRKPKVCCQIMHVKPNLLYKSDLVIGNLPPIKSGENYLLNRVVSIKSSHTVPTGLRGLIIGIQKDPTSKEEVFDIIFDEPFVGGANNYTSDQRCFKLSINSFLNISTNRMKQPVAQQPMPKPPEQCLDPAKTFVPPLQPPMPTPPPNPFAYLQQKQSAFVQWSQPPVSLPPKANDDAFKEMWTKLQNVKPLEETEVLKKILKIDGNRVEPKIEDSVKSFFERLRLDALDQPETTDERNTFKDGSDLDSLQNTDSNFSRLREYLSDKKKGHITIQYRQVGVRTIAEVMFVDGRIFHGKPCKSKDLARERVCRDVLSALNPSAVLPIKFDNVPNKKVDRVKANQIKLTKALMRGGENAAIAANERQPKNSASIEPNYFDTYIKPQRPPQHWLQSPQMPPRQFQAPPHKNDRADRQMYKNPVSVNPGTAKSTKSALGFVPLQVVTGVRNFKPIATTTPHSYSSKPEPSRRVEPKDQAPNTSQPVTKAERVPGKGPPNTARRRRIAANLGFDP